jgi:hypothetical protein
MNLWRRLMIALGLRTVCCYAKPYQPNGWEEQEYCSKCERRVA